MFKVDSLFVCCVDNHYVAFDQLEAIKWACTHTNYVVLVDVAPQPIHPAGDYEGYTILRPQNLHGEGFDGLTAVKHCLDQSALIGQAILLSQYALPVSRGLDNWCAGQIKSGYGILGVEDRHCFYESFTACSSMFAEWGVPHELYEDPPSTKTLAPGFQVIEGGLLRDLFNRQLLPPAGIEQWQLPFGVFLSWIAQMLNYTQLLHGHMDRQQPPLYVNEMRTRCLPAPHILSGAFQLFYSLKGVPGYSMHDLRQGYKRIREGG